MSRIDSSQLASEITKILNEFQDVTEEAVERGVIDAANEAVNELQSAHPPGSERYNSWNKYNSGWTRTQLKSSGKGYEITVHNKRYQLTHLLEKGHALKNGGRARAFSHIAPVEEKIEGLIISIIQKRIK